MAGTDQGQDVGTGVQSAAIVPEGAPIQFALSQTAVSANIPPRVHMMVAEVLT